MAEADGAEREPLCDKNVGSVDEQEEKEPHKPSSERTEGEEEGPGQSSQVYTASSLSLKPETEKRLITHPLVIFRFRTSQKIRHYNPIRSDVLYLYVRLVKRHVLQFISV